MKFEVVNSDELLQFIKDYNVDTRKIQIYKMYLNSLITELTP